MTAADFRGHPKCGCRHFGTVVGNLVRVRIWRRPESERSDPDLSIRDSIALSPLSAQ